MKSSFIPYFAGNALAGFSCGFILCRFVTDPESDEYRQYVLLAAALALGLAALFGFLSDVIRDNGRFFGGTGLVLCAAAMAVAENRPTLALVLSGIGCALFLTGGGTDASTQSSGLTRMGIFLSSALPGAALGTKLGGDGLIPVQYPVSLLIFAALAVLLLCSGKREKTDRRCPVRKENAFPVLFTSGMLLVAVFIGGFVCFAAPHAEYEGRFAFILPAAAAFAGMFAGGVICDTAGGRIVSSVSALLSAPLFFLGGLNYLIFAAAVFLAAAAAPAAFRGIVSKLPGYEGTGFGIALLAILLAFLIGGKVNVPVNSTVGRIAILILAEAVAVILFFTLPDKKTQKENNANE